MPQAATRAAPPAGVLTDPTWPVSLLWQVSAAEENDTVIAELRTKVSADLALALAPEPPWNATSSHKSSTASPCGVASTRGQSPRTLAAAVGLASSALAMGGRHRACGGDSNNRCGSLFCGTPARKTSPKTNCQETHAPRTRPAVPLEPKVRWGRRLDRRDEAVAQSEDPMHVQDAGEHRGTGQGLRTCSESSRTPKRSARRLLRSPA